MNTLPYFAFGSNMSQEQLKERKVNWNRAFPATLDNYQLIFNKKASYGNKSFANIEEASDSKVHGIVYYGLTDKDYDILDKYEGVWGGHYRKKVIKISVNDEIIEAITYIAGEDWIDKTSNLKSTKEYMDKLWAGKNYLPLEYLEMLKNVKINEGGEYGSCLDSEHLIQEKEFQTQVLPK